MKKALITGISGQDGSYLAEYLLSLGYEPLLMSMAAPPAPGENTALIPGEGVVIKL